MTSAPVAWVFTDSNARFDVLGWYINQTLADKEWQAPDYCFAGMAQSSMQSAGGTARELPPLVRCAHDDYSAGLPGPVGCVPHDD